MKKAIFIIIFSFLFLTSCSSKKDETFFIHAAFFDEKDGEFTVSVICESAKENDGEYFIIEKKAPSIEKASTLITKEHPNCYFATCNLFLVPFDGSQRLFTHLASTICDSNVYPSKSAIICHKRDNLKDKMKDPDFLSHLLQETAKKKVNCVKFFSLYSEGKSIFLPCYFVNVTSPKFERQIKIQKKEDSHES